jgi:lysophospholipase L1-like esterase
MKRYPILRNILFLSLPALLAILILLEMFFRFVIRACESPDRFFNEQEKIYSFRKKGETGCYTAGKFAEVKARWSINNCLWNYPVDYFPEKERKLIAVIGDSFIEALQVDVEKNYPYLLHQKLQPACQVYAFGVSGAPLSQYLHLSRYVNRHFSPDVLIFNLVHNDFLESLADLHQASWFLQLSWDPGKETFSETNPRPDYSSSQFHSWKRFLRKSALFRYIWFNLGIPQWFAGTRPAESEENIYPAELIRYKQLIIEATDYLIGKIREENEGKRILFVFDAPRYAIYHNSLDKSSVIWMHGMVRRICEMHNVEYLDLTGYMNQDYRLHRVPFNPEVDYHWNAYGHQLVADAVLGFLCQKDRLSR